MAKQQTDDELNIRRKQRRRLVGAVALTLAVVVVLPMVLDDAPKSTQADIELRIPDPDKAGEFVHGVEIPESSMPLPASATPAVALPPEDATPDAPAAPVQPSAVVKETPEKPATNVAPAITPATTIKTPAPKPAEKLVSAADTGYVAQVGAYSNTDAAKQELAKLKQWGFKAYTEKAGDKMRVRVGPYPSREKAETVGKLLEKRGLQPVILSAK
jgi:DedD protein